MGDTPYMLLCARDPLSVGIWIFSDVVVPTADVRAVLTLLIADCSS